MKPELSLRLQPSTMRFPILKFLGQHETIQSKVKAQGQIDLKRSKTGEALDSSKDLVEESVDFSHPGGCPEVCHWRYLSNAAMRLEAAYQLCPKELVLSKGVHRQKWNSMLDSQPEV